MIHTMDAFMRRLAWVFPGTQALIEGVWRTVETRGYDKTTGKRLPGADGMAFLGATRPQEARTASKPYQETLTAKNGRQGQNP